MVLTSGLVTSFALKAICTVTFIAVVSAELNTRSTVFTGIGVT